MADNDRKSPEYLAGPDGVPVGPDVDGLTDTQRASIEASMQFFTASADRINHFTRRVEELGRTGADTVITLIDVDDPTGHGALLADLLMPGIDWQQFRDRGEVPVARGLAAKEAMPGILAKLGYIDAAEALRATDELQVIVLHAQSVQVMDVTFA